MYNKLWKRNIHDSCNVKQMHNIQRTYNICTTNYGNEIYTIHVMLNKCITYNAPTIYRTTTYGNEIYTIHVMLNKCITYNAPTIYVQQTMETKYTRFM